MPADELPAVPRELVEYAAHILEWRGYVEDLDDDEWEGLLTELSLVALSAADHWCSDPSGYITHPDHIADHWVAIRQEAWERSLPTLACQCGRVFKVIGGVAGLEGTQFYELEDGCCGEYVGGVRCLAGGKIKGAGACAGCGRAFAETEARRADDEARQAAPQGSLW
jgi:hypothetical protein